ncbi:UbiA prenyltransferase family protein [Costertonia aggregata]|uniref:UbiA family prenyltransferase n=1 Tax=Costertonia aggregata TaxID=343403 RepID=A0A7H9ARB2_9FLAO|nr:hypothetical protein [Costertonia aggregata]QLG45993.1 hypothetical protein HYG79_11765 [Costertonia aggregata]
MTVLQRIFDFYLDASIHVAFAVLALVHATGLTLNIPTDEHLSWFLFFGSVTCYNFIKYGVEAEKYVLVANRYHKNIQLASFIVLGFAVYHAFFLTMQVWVTLILLFFLTALYALPVLPNAKNLRSLGGLKIFIVALVWSGTTVMLPYIVTKNTLVWDVWIEACQRFVLVLILLIPFEIRDLRYDSPELKTLPQRYGVAKTKIIGSFMVLLFFFLSFLKDDLSYRELVAKGVLFLILGGLMYVTKRNQSKYFSSFWVEGVPILFLMLLVGLKFFF